MGRYSRTLKDYDGEETTIGVHCADLNAGNIATEITAQANFGAAINDISTGSLQRIKYGNQVISNQVPPTDKWSQRELKWRVDFVDDVNGEPGWFTIGTADASILNPANKKVMDITNAAVIAFITAMEAYVLSKDGNAVSFVQGLLVGRNV